MFHVNRFTAWLEWNWIRTKSTDKITEVLDLIWHGESKICLFFGYSWLSGGSSDGKSRREIIRDCWRWQKVFEFWCDGSVDKVMRQILKSLNEVLSFFMKFFTENCHWKFYKPVEFQLHSSNLSPSQLRNAFHVIKCFLLPHLRHLKLPSGAGKRLSTFDFFLLFIDASLYHAVSSFLPCDS